MDQKTFNGLLKLSYESLSATDEMWNECVFLMNCADDDGSWVTAGELLAFNCWIKIINQ